MDGYLVSREVCPEAYSVMEGMNIDNGRFENRRAQTCQEVQVQGETCQE